MGRRIGILTAGILLPLAAILWRVSLAREDDFVIEDDVQPAPNPPTEHAGPERCCSTGSAGFINLHLVLASTMDGRVTAMDVNNNGEVVWSVDADKVPLLSSSLGSQQLVVDNSPYMLVPSLDGSLYMFNVKNSALSPIPRNADLRIMIGDDEIAGGIFVTSTGVDPLTGKILYQCTAGKCVKYETPPNNLPPYTLIMRKNTQVARAANPLTGAEKWNLSVGEYEISLVLPDHSFRLERTNVPAHVRFLLQPPVGIVSAVDSCGNLKWEKRLPSPIARVWQLARGNIFEVSLFSPDTVGALSEFNGNGGEFIPKYEAPFYFGTVNSHPYIIPSDRLREELRHAATIKEAHSYSHLQPKTVGATSAHFTAAVPYLEDLKVGDLIRRSYWTAANAIDSDLLNGISKPVSSRSLTCSMYDAVTIAGSRELREAGSYHRVQGDRGWYIFKPVRCQTNNPFGGPYQKREYSRPRSKRCKRKNVFEELREIACEPVSGWWKIIAVFLTLIAASLIATIGFCSFWLQRPRLLVYWYVLKSGSCRQSGSAVPSKMQSGADAPANPRPDRSTTSTSVSQQDPFVSKFLEDFIPEKWLGSGGYGVVFNCRNRLDDRSYAVKRIAVSNTSAAIDRVKREARAMAQLDHPGIIRYFHTWLEKPPPGWQQAKDKEIMKNIRTAAASLGDSFMQTSESELNILHPKKASAIKDLSFGEKLLNGLNIPTVSDKDGVFSNDTGDLSWADDGNDNKVATSSRTEISTETESGSSVPGLTAVVVENDDSTSVIFTHNENSVRNIENCEENKSKKGSSPDPFKPPAVLVTSVEELQSCWNTKNYVYLYIQMELCQELTLHNWLLTNNSTGDREITRMRTWFAEIVCAIDYIHSQGLIHRDLKPQNIFFSADNYMKIGDLGLATNHAKVDETGEYRQDTITNISHTGNVGTRLYMSPEQLKGKPYNEKIDIFSLGLIFVELIVPFKTVMERNDILSGLQNGIIPNCLHNRTEERNFVAWLTSGSPEQRPSARQIAQCEYLRSEVHMLGISYFREQSSSCCRS